MAKEPFSLMISRTIIAAAGAASFIGGATSVGAQEYYLAQVLPIAGSYCPTGTLEASGGLLPISQNQALFSLLSTNYGGDGITTFALPDMRGREIIHLGQGNGLPDYALAQRGGRSSVTLDTSTMPPHSHTGTGVLEASAVPATAGTPTGNSLATSSSPLLIYDTTAPDQPLGAGTIDVVPSTAGAGQPFQLQSPYQVIRWCIVTEGLFPSRN